MRREPFLYNLVERLKGKTEKVPEVNLSVNAGAAILGVVKEKKTDQLSETPFLGIEKDGQIVEVLTSEGSQAKSRLERVSSGGFAIAVDRNQLAEQFNRADRAGVLDDVTMLGHLHPSGETRLDGVTYVVEPSESLLEPSMEDIDFARSFTQLNPGSKIKHFGIAANTPSGPQLAIWKVDDLVRVKKFRDLEKIPKQKINLIK